MTTLTRITGNARIERSDRDLLRSIEQIANPFATATQEARLGTLALPAYALDGRTLQWSPDQKAVSFVATEQEYHSDISAVSSTALKAIQRSPAHMRAQLLFPSPDTDARRMGRAVHCAVLEAHRFDADYVVWRGRRRQGYEWEVFQEKNANRTILTVAEYDKVIGCAESILSAPVVESDGVTYFMRDLVHGGEPEKTIYFLDDATGLTCRARIDLAVHNITVDLKTTDDARDSAFALQSYNLGYDLQSAFYLRARKALLGPSAVGSAMPFLFIAAELAAPHCCVVHCADQEAFVDEGERKVDAGLKIFAQCAASNVWPGYPDRKSTLRLPLNKRFPTTDLRI